MGPASQRHCRPLFALVLFTFPFPPLTYKGQSPSSWRRGSKPRQFDHGSCVLQVAFFAEAWIETSIGRSRSASRIVAFFAEAWIETTLASLPGSCWTVAFFAEAWIETFYFLSVD